MGRNPFYDAFISNLETSLSTSKWFDGFAEVASKVWWSVEA